MKSKDSTQFSAALESDGRDVVVAAEIPRDGRSRTLLDGQPIKSRSKLADIARFVVFVPGDIEVIRGGPQFRRDTVDDLLSMITPADAQLVSDFNKSIRQRNAFLQQCHGRISTDQKTTLDVWNARVVDYGTALAQKRNALCEDLNPIVSDVYAQIATDDHSKVTISYESASLDETLLFQLEKAIDIDVRRGTTSVGPHRDDVNVSLDGMASRSHGSSGQQRTLALALRLAARQVISNRARSLPPLLLDDVFSELDTTRERGVLELAAGGQIIITTTGPLPDKASPARQIVVNEGRIESTT